MPVRCGAKYRAAPIVWVGLMIAWAASEMRYTLMGDGFLFDACRKLSTNAK